MRGTCTGAVHRAVYIADRTQPVRHGGCSRCMPGKMRNQESGRYGRTAGTRVAGLASGLLLLASGAQAQGLLDHLKCHTARTPRRPIASILDLNAGLQAGFSDRGCRVIGRPTTVCVPVAAGNLRPQPRGPVTSGPTLGSSYTCYNLQCPSTPPPGAIADEFGSGRVSFGPATKLCVPAVIDACSGGTCGSHSFDCHESGACACFNLSRGQHFCGVPTACATAFRCKSGTQGTNRRNCPAGFVCETDTCCGHPVCVPTSTLCIPGQPPPPSPPPGVATTISAAGVLPTVGQEAPSAVIPTPPGTLDHLKCHAATTGVAAVPTTTDLAASPSLRDFSSLGCTVLGTPDVCVPVTATNVRPPPPNPVASGPPLTMNYTCYRLICPGSGSLRPGIAPGVQPHRHEVADQFGSGQVDFLHTTTLCVPATDGSRNTTTSTTITLPVVTTTLRRTP